MNAVDELFEKTKQGIREILKSDILKKIVVFTYKGVYYNFTDNDIHETLPKIQAINAGVLDEVPVYDKNGEEIMLSAEEYIARNQEGFKNKMKHEVDLDVLYKILDKIQNFTALANFGSFDMAKKYYLEAKKEKQEVEETGEEIIEE